VEFECDAPVNVLVGYVQSADPAWLKVPQLETDALAGENFVSEALIQNAASIDTLPAVNVHIHRFPAGRHRLEVRGAGSFIVLGVTLAEKESPRPSAPAAPDSSAAAPARSSSMPAPAVSSTPAAAPRAVSQARYRISVCDWMILKRQKLGAFELAAEIGADGLELDIGGLGTRETWDNKLKDPAVRQQFIDKAASLGLSISSIAMSGFYAQSFAERPNYRELIAECVDLMKATGAKVAFLPLGVKGDLVQHPELRPVIIERLKAVAPLAEKAGVVLGIETALDASAEARLLDEVGSPAVRSYFNFANALQNGRDLHAELSILGRDRIAQIHCTDQDGVWLQDNTRLDMKRVRRQLDDMGWSGWLVIERSRDIKDPKNVRKNFSANARFLKSCFQP
jgi:sugar phosphate isomerase/epimerase